MRKDELHIVEELLEEVMGKEVYSTLIDASSFGVQKRKRYFFTTFHVPPPANVVAEGWSDILEDIEDVQHLKVSDRLVEGLNKTVNNSKTKGFATRLEAFGDRWLEVHLQSQNKSRWHYVTQHSDADKENHQL